MLKSEYQLIYIDIDIYIDISCLNFYIGYGDSVRVFSKI